MAITVLPILMGGLATFAITAALTPALAKWARRRRFLDIPNERSSHAVATPRLGGAALVTGVIGGVAVLYAFSGGLQADAAVVLGGSLLIAGLGLADDFWQLPALTRLIVQILVAAVVVASVDRGYSDSWFLMTVTVFWIAAATNAYNFMDGIDGIAGAQAVVAGLGWVLVGTLAGSQDSSTLGLLVAAAAFGFLLHNWQPASVFMGDAGSGFLGFLFAAFPLLSPPSAQPFVSWAAILLLWPFLFDTLLTLIRRAIGGENVLMAHRSHLYQRLVQTGRSHRYVSLLYAVLALSGLIGAAAIFVDRRAVSAAVFSLILTAAGLLWREVLVREGSSSGAATG
jgi:UDP-N-acetylmuramyl pentapeptide phosphotransferase/UDP-N-acetylglucosamine-1-phosphate transferase